MEKAVIIGALTVFEAFEVNMTRLFLFGFFDNIACVGSVGIIFNVIDNIELQSPDDVGRILDIAGFFERLEGNGLHIIVAIETADNNKGCVGVTLKLFELADGVVNGELNINIVLRDNLEIIKTNNRSLFEIRTERTQNIEEVVNGLVAEFKNV